MLDFGGLRLLRFTCDVSTLYESSNTRDQLRGAHDRALVQNDSADDDAPTRLQPPLVSCIALFGGLAALAT